MGLSTTYTKLETDYLLQELQSELSVEENVNINNLVKGVSGKAVYDYTTQKINTIADLRNTIGKEEGQIVELLGYYEAGEYSLKYKWTNTQGVDDGGSVINSSSGSWLAIFGEVVTPEYFGAKGNGVINDTLAIQRCLNYKATKVVFAKEKYLIDSIYINGKFGCKIKGSQIILSDRTDIDLGIEIRSNAWLDITGFQIKGNSSNVSKCRGIYSNSGNQLININIYDNEIDLCSLGISLNSDLGGDLRDCSVFRNKITNILGETAGNGYGIHVSHHSYLEMSNVNIYNNYIENCERHSIYLARGKGYNIYKNFIVNHRKNLNLSPDPRAAIDISRVSDVECYNNSSLNGNGGALMILGDDRDVVPIVKNIKVYNNNLENINNMSTLFVGYLNPNSFSIIENIDIYNNTIVYKGSPINYSISIRYGKNIHIRYNNIISTSRGISLDNYNDTTTNENTDNLFVYNNIFNTSEACILLGDASKSPVNIEVKDNIFPDSSYVFNSPYNISNPNISYFNLKSQTLGVAFVAGNSFKRTYTATTTTKGLVNQSTAVTSVTTADATDLTTALTLINELKSKLNAKLAADIASGQQATFSYVLE